MNLFKCEVNGRPVSSIILQLYLMAVCKLLSDTTHICITAVAQLAQICLAIHIGRATIGIHACVCALQQHKCVKEVRQQAEASKV